MRKWGPEVEKYCCVFYVDSSMGRETADEKRKCRIAAGVFWNHGSLRGVGLTQEQISMSTVIGEKANGHRCM